MIIAIIVIGSLIFYGVDGVIDEYKRGKLFKRESQIQTGRAAYEMGTEGQVHEEFGCGTWFIITVVVGLIFYFFM